MSIRSQVRSRRSLLFAALLGTLVVLALAACGGSDSSSGATTEGSAGPATSEESTSPADTGASEAGGSEANASDIQLAMITASQTQNAFIEMNLGAEAAAGVEGVTLNSAAPPAVDPTKELQLFQAAKRTSKDGIAIEVTAPDLFVRPWADAVDEGIPIASVDTPPPAASNVTLFVGNSNTDVGRQLATAMLDKIPADAEGEIVLGNPIPGLPVLDQRIDGMKEVLQAERPNIKLLGPFNTGPEPTENYEAWSALVKAHPDAIAYLDPGDQAVVSLSRIQEQTGESLLVGGCDLDPAALEAVKEGRVYALADPLHWLKGYIAISLLAEHAKTGDPLPEGWWNPGSSLITQENVDEIIERQKDNQTRLAYFEEEANKQLADPSAYLKPISEAN